MTTQNCGDTCGLIDFTMAVAGDRLLPEEKMNLAIEAVTSGKMSQRGAAEKYGVAQSALSVRLRKLIADDHPAKTQSTTQSSAGPQPIPSDPQPPKRSQATQDKLDRTTAIRNLARENGMGKIDGKYVRDIGAVALYEALTAAGIAVPDSAIPRSLLPKAEPKAETTSTPSTLPVPTNDPATTERLSPNDHVPAQQCDWTAEGLDDSDPIFDEELNIDAVRDHVCAQVQRSDRPADFKRAIELLRELDAICADAWYRRHPEPWNHHDWAHVNSEVKAIQSLTGQRAQETADQLFLPRSAVTVNATAVA